MSILKYKKALLAFCRTDHWDNVCAFTFNLKHAVKLKEVYFNNKKIEWYRLDKIRCEQCFKEFMRDLNRRVYKSAYIKYGKRLQTMAFLEKSKEGRFHYHAAIEAPKHMTQDEFCKFAMHVWLEQYFGYPIKRGLGHITFIFDSLDTVPQLIVGLNDTIFNGPI